MFTYGLSEDESTVSRVMAAVRHIKTYVAQKPHGLIGSEVLLLHRTKLPVLRVVNAVLLRPAIDECAIAGTCHSGLYSWKDLASLLGNAAKDGSSAHRGPSTKRVSQQLFSEAAPVPVKDLRLIPRPLQHFDISQS